MTLKFHTQDLQHADRILSSGGVKNIVFSNKTYQVEVDDLTGVDPTWIFMQLDTKGEIQDGFCSCAKAEYTQSCPHLAAGSLAIFCDGVPLHEKYAESLLYHFFFIAARRYGFEPEVLKKVKDNTYQIKTKTEKSSFRLELLSDEALEKLIELFDKPKETEENSIKFSNLTAEELKLYRDGNPTFDLLFELSFWGDFSKWVFSRAKKKDDLTIELVEGQHEIPFDLKITTKDISCTMFIAKVNWQEIIESLKPHLQIHDFSSFILEKITYDPKTKRLVFSKLPSRILDDKKDSVDLGTYFYIENEGFFPKEDDEIFLQDAVPCEKIAYFFHQYPNLIKKYLKNVSFSNEKQKANYRLFFDEKAQFHIELFVENQGDLVLEDSGVFLPYVYLPKKGFFPLKDLFFDGLKKVIPSNKMSHFIDHFKHWLNQFEGFQIHLNSVESALTYQMQKDESLKFSLRDKIQAESGLIDLEEWCYLKGFGFFPKVSQRTSSNIKPGTSVEKGSIASFIDHHLIDLETISGFFLPKSPVKNIGLKVGFNSDELIVIEPKIDLFQKEHEGKISIYGSYGYLKGSGFFPLKDGYSLPKGYEEKKVIPRFLEEQFLHFEWNQIQKYILECDPRLQRIDKGKFVVESVKEEESKRFFFKIYYETDHGKTHLGEFIEPYLSNKAYFASDSGLVFFDQPGWDFLKILGKKNYSKTTKDLKLSLLDWIKISVFIKPEFTSGCNAEIVKKLKDSDAIAFSQIEGMPLLEGFKSQLRPYQATGLKWLWHLYQYDLSGILADDMGLGKTHQAMALLAACLNQPKNLGKKYLVVCPTSVIYHWQNLLKNFLPFAKVMLFYGPSRTIEGFDENYDILLTSYGTLRSDIKILSPIGFELAILDEMHVAKNQQSQVHKSLKKIQAQMKLGLTGTPIENDLSELKALFDVVLPQYLPDTTTFKEQFVYPIEKLEDKERKILLKRLIAPFVLRRKKTEVLHDLPEKIEEISYVDLSDEQKLLYKRIVEEKKLNIDEDTEENFYLHVFQLFNKLKQLCNHPALLMQDVANYQQYQSGKFELFKELLQEALQSGQKVVVFSQYLGMLDIFRLYLDEQKIGFAGIQGNTRDRKEQIEKFKTDQNCQVFLASLQAAGVGIDLVSASVVIHYDRWWNPAKENQATDRVHRIGQTRGVQVFKFVSKDTVEEHIHEMILKKLNLAQSIVDYDEQFEIKRIDRQELIHLLKLVKQDLDKR